MAPIVIGPPPKRENLHQVIDVVNAKLADEGYGTRFIAQPLPQPGQGCRERMLLRYIYGNGFLISSTEVASTLDGQVVAFHPKFSYQREEGVFSLRGLLEEKFEEDLLRIERRGSASV